MDILQRLTLQQMDADPAEQITGHPRLFLLELTSVIIPEHFPLRQSRVDDR